MTTYFPFAPTNQAPFQFQPTLDDATYNAVVTWNLFGQRWYVTVSALDGTPQFSLPLIGSPVGAILESLTWDSGFVTAVALAPHGFAIGSDVPIEVVGAAPAALSGTFLCHVVDPLTFTFPLASDPGTTTAPGTAYFNISLSAGYFRRALPHCPCRRACRFSSLLGR